MDEIMELSLAQFLLLSVEASDIENKSKESGAMNGYNAPSGQSFKR